MYTNTLITDRMTSRHRGWRKMCREPLPGHNSPSVTRRVLAELRCLDMATDSWEDRRVGRQTGSWFRPSVRIGPLSISYRSSLIPPAGRNHTRKLSGHLQPHVTDLITFHWLSLTCDQRGKNMVGSPFPARSR